jgi:hypothetical protein
MSTTLLPGSTEFQVNQNASDASGVILGQLDPDITALSTGLFAISYVTEVTPGSNLDINGQFLSKTGTC